MTKIATDLEQSKTLAKILPIESADMFYSTINNSYPWVWEGKPLLGINDIPAWSLTALLKVFKDYTLQDTTDGRCFVVSKNICSDLYDEPVDACVDMIILLNKKG